MNIKLSYVAWLEVKNFPSGSILEVADGASIEDILVLCGMKQEHHKFIVPVVNGMVRDLNDPVYEGDTIHLMMPIGGG